MSQLDHCNQILVRMLPVLFASDDNTSLNSDEMAWYCVWVWSNSLKYPSMDSGETAAVPGMHLILHVTHSDQW